MKRRLRALTVVFASELLWSWQPILHTPMPWRR
jgi:hypothetical protein